MKHILSSCSPRYSCLWLWVYREIRYKKIIRSVISKVLRNTELRSRKIAFHIARYIMSSLHFIQIQIASDSAVTGWWWSESSSVQKERMLNNAQYDRVRFSRMHPKTCNKYSPIRDIAEVATASPVGLVQILVYRVWNLSTVYLQSVEKKYTFLHICCKYLIFSTICLFI